MRPSAIDAPTVARQAALVVGLLALWQYAAIHHPSPQVPRLEAVAAAYLRLAAGDLARDTLLPSLARMLVGFAAGATIGVVVGTAIGHLRALDPWVRPLLEVLRFTPAVAVLPAALILLGPTDVMRVSVIAFGTTFPVLLSADDGARRVEPLLIEVARIAGLGPARRLVRVVVPAALPAIFAGLRIALAIALITMVISELIAADDGLGLFILRSQRLFQTANVYAGTLVIGTIGFVLTNGFLALERHALRWHAGWRGVG